MALAPEELKTLLFDNHVVTPEVYAAVEKTAKHLSIPVTEVLVGRRIISESDLGGLIAKKMNVGFIDLKKVDIKDDMMEFVPEEMAIERHAIPFEKHEGKLLVAMEDPANLETIEFIQKRTDMVVEPYLAMSSGIKYALKKYKKGIKEFVRILGEWTHTTQPTGVKVEKLAQDVSVIRIVDAMIEYAVSESASDIHIEGLSSGVLIRYRIDGVLHDVITLPKSLHSAIVARIKILSDLKLDETRMPQDGRIRFKTKDGDTISLRVSVLPTVEGEKIVLRILESVLQRFSLEELGFTPEDTKIMKNEISKPHGLILVTGPTGSGKTTTLYTVLTILDTPEVNISTVEDPVENRVPRVNQTQINPTIDFTFANGLRSLLRQDPNIIMVGEIRDSETGGIAVNAAMTGHLVLSTLHTNDAPGAIPRLIDLGVEPFLIASTLNLVMAQRLVRLICSECKTLVPISDEMMKSLVTLLVKQGYSEQDAKTYVPNEASKGEGCTRCDFTGYKGRVGIYEMVPIDDDFRALIIKKTTAEEIRKTALQKGMRTMLSDGLIKVSQGKTTIDEVLRVTLE